MSMKISPLRPNYKYIDELQSTARCNKHGENNSEHST
jgi:hypothetical protein